MKMAFGKIFAVCVLLQAAWAASSNQPDGIAAGGDSSRSASSDTHPTQSSGTSEMGDNEQGREKFDFDLYCQLLKEADEQEQAWREFRMKNKPPSKWLW